MTSSAADTDPAAAVGDRLQRLERSVADLVSRVDALERRSDGSTRPTLELAAAESVSAGQGERLRSLPALVGRTLLVLSGAFAVRALTEGGTLSAGVGVTLGVVYALLWLVIADRAASRGEALSGVFHALAFALVVYPLLFEATALLALVTPIPATLLLIAANTLGLTVAWRRDSRLLAWIQQVGALAVASLLLFRTRAVLVFGLALLALALGSLVLAYGRGWRGQRWLVAIGVDAVVALLGVLWLLGRTPPEWLSRAALVTLQLALATLYLGGFVLRLLVQERKVTGFAVAQTVLVLLLGFEAALRVADAGERRWVAIVALAAAVLLHTLLARRAEARVGHGAAVGYFASLATFLAAEAIRVLAPRYAPLVWLAAAVALAALALAAERPILQVHAALLAAAGAAISGLLAAAVAALALPAASAWPTPPPHAAWLLALGLATALLLYRGRHAVRDGPLARLARLLALASALVTGGGALARILAAMVEAPGLAANSGHLATLRTAILAILAIALAAAARRLSLSELARMAAVVLAAGALKLLAEDLRRGNATDLLFSLAIYGAALIAVPALTRGGRAATPG